tara:strand:+ start:17934 stop:22367 length:4434 start_codon:yes stop_codon:yes gene_type:complete
MAEEKKIFAGGGMDMDTEERFIKGNDYRYALNCRITSSDEENEGTVENIRGNNVLNSGLTTSDGTPLSSEDFKVIGHYEDKKLNILYYFIAEHADGGIISLTPRHCIVSNYGYSASLGGIPAGFRILHEDPLLNFHKDKLITGVNMIHSEEFAKGGMLYWTDDRNPPRKLNVLRAYWWAVNPGNITDPALSYLEPPVLDAIPKAPTEPPAITIGTWSSKKANYIKESLWQFKYRYVYRDFQKSSWSPISESVTTRHIESGAFYDSNNLLTGLLEEDNAIQVRLINGRLDVISMDIAVRRNGTGEDFYLVGSVKKDNSIQENITLTTFGNPANIGVVFPIKTMIPDNLPNWTHVYFIFTGEEPRMPIDIKESNKLYDDVPLLAKSQEIVDGNRLVYGNIVNGYDPVFTDTELSVVYKETDDIQQVTTPITYGVRVTTDTDTWASSTASRTVAKFELNIYVPSFFGRVPGEQLYLQMDGVTFSTHLFRGPSTFCDKEEGVVVGKVGFNMAPYVYSPASSLSDLLDHCRQEGQIDFTQIFNPPETGPNADLDMGAGHTTSSNNIVNQPISFNGSYPGIANSGSTAIMNALWQSSGTNTIRIRFHISHSDPMNPSCTHDSELQAAFGMDGYHLQAGAFPNTGPSALLDTGMSWMPIDGEGRDGDGDIFTNPDWRTKATYLECGACSGSPLADLNLLNYEIDNNMALVALPLQEIGNHRAFKSGTRHNFGLVYYDSANRSGTVNKAGSVYVPSRNEREEIIADYTAHIHFKINHLPPDWATHYQWVHSAKRIEKFVHITSEYIFHDPSVNARYNTVLPASQIDVDGSGVAEGGFQAIINASTGLVNGAVIMNMEELIKHSGRSSENTFLWDWKKGDRVKIIDKTIANGGPFPNFSGLDFAIVGVLEDVNSEYPGTQAQANGVPSTGAAQLYYVLEQSSSSIFQTFGHAIDARIELYRPSSDTEDIYHEFNHANKLGWDSSGTTRIHRANTWACNFNEGQLTTMGYTNPYVDDLGVNTPAVFSYNQYDPANPDPNLPAEGTFLNGDVYVRQRIMSNAFGGGGVLYAEDYSASDFFKSDGWDLGRPNAFLPDFKQTRREATIFFSEPFIPNTAINGLGTFYPDVSFQEYDKSYNSIQKLFSINDSLIILQEDKVSKAMVSRSVLFDATAKQNVAISQNVLSSSLPYVGDFGISRNPESFANFGFRSYFVDIKRRVVLRLSQDGLTPISEHKMKNFFTDYFQEVIDENRHIGSSFKAYGAYDNKFDEYVVSIADISWSTLDMQGNTIKHGIPGFTIGFNEPSKKWNSFYSYNNNIATYNAELHSFRKGIVYQHNAAKDSNDVSIYNNFYGVDHPSVLEFPVNSMPDVTKVFHTISEHANNIWEVDAFYTRNGQMTDISRIEFTGGNTYTWEEGHGTKENIHNATIRCDVLTPGIVNPKIEGDRMRDTSVMCRLALPIPQAQEQNVLFAIRFGFIASSSPSLIGNQ